MKKTLLLAPLALFAALLVGQAATERSKEHDAIRAAVLNYPEGWYDGAAARWRHDRGIGSAGSLRDHRRDRHARGMGERNRPSAPAGLARHGQTGSVRIGACSPRRFFI